MKMYKGERRQAKRDKKRRGMRVRGRSVKLLANLNTQGKKKARRRKRGRIR